MKTCRDRPISGAGSRRKGTNALLTTALLVAATLAGGAAAGGKGLGAGMGSHSSSPPTHGEQRCFNEYIGNSAKCVATFCHSFLFFGWCEDPEFGNCVNNAQQVFDECMESIKNGGFPT